MRLLKIIQHFVSIQLMRQNKRKKKQYDMVNAILMGNMEGFYTEAPNLYFPGFSYISYI